MPIGRRRDPADQAAVHPTELDGLAGADRKRGREQFDAFGTELWRHGILNREERFHRRFQCLSETKGNGGVGDIVAGLNGIYGLTTDAGVASKGRGGDAAFAANAGELVVYFHRSI